MRKPFIIANWKMNKNVHESVAFVKAIKEKLPTNKEIGIAAQAVSLYNMKEVAGNSNLQIIAQNASAELEGPYTGEISMRSLADAGVTYVMLGHLERRRLFNESNDAINQKVLAALQVGIIPIICTDEEMVQILSERKGKVDYWRGNDRQIKDSIAVNNTFFDENDIPKVLPNTNFFAINLNRLYGELPNWLLYHPKLDLWYPELLIWSQEGRAKDGNKAGFSNAPTNLNYYYDIFVNKKYNPKNYTEE